MKNFFKHMNNRILRISGIALLAIQACKPDIVGYINDNLRYNIAEIQVVQGTSNSTPPLIANGSTTPLNVALLDVRNKATGQSMPEFLEPQEFSVFLGTVDATDTTLEQLNAKIGVDKKPSISVNSIGGRAIFSPATENIPPGLYTIDLQVSNVSGTKIMKEPLDINLIAMKPDSIFASSCNTSKAGAETPTTTYSDYDVTIEHLDNGENKIVYMWLDKNGNPFNPAKGEIVRRANQPSFEDWSPFYEEIATENSLEYQYPYFKGLVYPLKNSIVVNGATFSDNPAANYRIVSDVSDLRLNINTSTTARFYKPGTHIIKFKLRNVARTGFPVLQVTTITYNVSLPVGDGYTATPVNIDPDRLASIFGIPAGEISGKINSDIKYYGIKADGTLDPNSTANAPGHWFDADGNTVGYGGSAVLFSELKAANMVFNVGQYPGHTAAGDTYTFKQALEYIRPDNNVRARVNFVFNITIK